ncbi:MULTISPECIES: bifunctional nuclease family protein [unclassified Meiothermus]|uniref:bifunctional nuclease family protein n=1 Tax=unclassified Meiothermus TaxID=370471 RepID=UPI000D7C73C3|nr:MULTISPECIES: bifunctional nuclease family protein [unclassified Meiothermus]PZA08073.1 bifunctional nuclease family protein [Meiothermus sp. Pnk-1]RYM39018.1 bifunctional nuclease family protein [Meiothermus sp. PNK-Is4]
MIPAEVETLGLDPTTGNVVVLLKTQTGAFLPIVIGPLEAQHIMVHLQGETPSRPLTPDLFLSVLDILGVRLVRVEVVELKDGVFFGRLVLEQRGLEYEVDARPSDCLGLAIRAQAPILVAESVLNDAGVDESSLRSGENPQA